MLCDKCGALVDEEQSKEWEEITTKCTVKIAITSIDPKQAYTKLSYKEIEIGSFNWEQSFFYYNDNSQCRNMEKKFKVCLIPKHGDLFGYFRVFKKKGHISNIG